MTVADHAQARVPSERQGSAIVIGASMAGMLAARALSDTFARVIVFERDHLPQEPAPRGGVPQGKHLHVLLPRGLEIIEEFFPGISQELETAGAVRLDVGSDIGWLTPQGWGINFRSGLEALSFTRELLDTTVRRRLERLPQVKLIDECHVKGLLAQGAERVLGVRARQQGGEDMDCRAELVVVAAGRPATLPAWLAAHGLTEPETKVINAHVGYASRMFRRPKKSRERWKAMFVQAAPPAAIRAGVIFPVEGERWLVTLQGGDRDYPPIDDSGFLEFAKGLRSPLFYEAIRDAEPLTPISSYRATENRRRLYERVSPWPERLLVIGDAMCAFNPVYGQGMTTAALAARALREMSRNDGRQLNGLARKFHRRQAEINAAPWMLATSEDLRFRSVEGAAADWKTRRLHTYVDAVLRLATKSPVVRKKFLQVQSMVRGPETVFGPAVLLRVLLSVATRRLPGKKKRVERDQQPSATG